MTTQTEGLHTAEFLVSEANGTLSRKTGTVKSGETLKVGELVMLSGGELVAHDGSLDTAGGDVVTPVEGIMYEAVDATGGAAAGKVYVDRLAEVVDDLLTYPAETSAGGEKAACQASLLARNIKTL